MKEPLRTLLLMGVKQAGSYDPAEVLIYIEEMLSFPDIDVAGDFLKWCHKNGRKFGHGNIEKVFQDFQLQQVIFGS